MTIKAVINPWTGMPEPSKPQSTREARVINPDEEPSVEVNSYEFRATDAVEGVFAAIETPKSEFMGEVQGTITFKGGVEVTPSIEESIEALESSYERIAGSQHQPPKVIREQMASTIQQARSVQQQVKASSEGQYLAPLPLDQAVPKLSRNPEQAARNQVNQLFGHLEDTSFSRQFMGEDSEG